MESQQQEQQQQQNNGVVVDDNNCTRLKCDYLVIGAGTAGMSFVDTLLTENPIATVILVDRNERAGGHWTKAYPFVRLHQPSCNYGVNSLRLGKTKDFRGREVLDGNDLATGLEIVEYYQSVVDTRFKPTGRVQLIFNSEYKGKYYHKKQSETKEEESLQEQQQQQREQKKEYLIASNKNNVNNNTNELQYYIVECKKKLVTVATAVIVPSMREPLIPVHESIRSKNFASVNQLPQAVESGKFTKYIVFGAGKTGIDAVIYLLHRCSIDQSNITWIISRDVWFLIRDGLFGASMEETDDSSATTTSERKKKPVPVKTMVKFFQCMTGKDVNSIKECMLQMEKERIVARLPRDDEHFPEVCKGPTIYWKEYEMLCTVQNVVRMGRATSISGNNVITFQKERETLKFSTTSDDGDNNTLLIDCMVDNLYGYSDFDEKFTLFERDCINLGPLLALFNPSFSSALIAYLEAHFNDDDRKKNQCCFYLRGAKLLQVATPSLLIGGIYLQQKTLETIIKYANGMNFIMNSRTNTVGVMHHGGWLGTLWRIFGPTRLGKKGKRVVQKVESHGYNDLDHCFGIETFYQQFDSISGKK